MCAHTHTHAQKQPVFDSGPLSLLRYAQVTRPTPPPPLILSLSRAALFGPRRATQLTQTSSRVIRLPKTSLPRPTDAPLTQYTPRLLHHVSFRATRAAKLHHTARLLSARGPMMRATGARTGPSAYWKLSSLALFCSRAPFFSSTCQSNHHGEDSDCTRARKQMPAD